MPTKTSLENENTVQSYSKMGAREYDDPMNLDFLYGGVTKKFLKNVPFSTANARVLDIGCGTGFGFDILTSKFDTLDMSGIGIEPAEGMLELAHKKWGEGSRFEFLKGSFENIPLGDLSIDRIISTLALHWVKDFDIAVQEMRRVLKDDGRIDILMIAKDDGANFKKAIVDTQKQHLSFRQIMKSAVLVQRLTAEPAAKTLQRHFGGFKVDVTEHRETVYGTFEEHMRWWKARSTPVISEVKDKEQFFIDLRVAMERRANGKRIPFDAAFLFITVTGR